MQKLQEIMEEMDDHAIELEVFGICDNYISVGWVKEIILSHMKNDGWILCSERLPEIPEKDYEDDFAPEFNVTIVGADAATTLKYAADGTWFDDNGNIYDVVAWQPLPEPYKGEK